MNTIFQIWVPGNPAPRLRRPAAKASHAFAAAAAFSLIELLIVVAVLALMAVLVAPAVSSIGQARGMTAAAYEITAAVELARSEAISRKTYVWMGLQSQTNGGNIDLRIGLVFSKDATGTNTASGNLQPIGRPLLIERVGLAPTAGLDVGTSLSSATDLSTYSGGAKFTVGSMTTSDKRTITFTPMGEVTTKPDPTSTSGFDPRIAIGLSQTHGTALESNNSIAIVIDGSVGTPTIYRK